MSDNSIIEKASGSLKEHELPNYEELKNAIESQKLIKEMRGMHFNRLIAITSAITAIASVLILVWQTNFSIAKDQKDFLKTKIEDLETDLDDLNAESKKLDVAISKKEKREEAFIESFEQRNQELTEINTEIEEKQTTVSRLNTTISQLENQTTDLSEQIALGGNLNQLRARLQQLTSELAANKNEIKNLKTAAETLKSQQDQTLEELNVEQAKYTQAKEQLDRFKNFGLQNSMELADLQKGKSIELGPYKVTLTNTGNHKDNLDLAVNRDGIRGTNLLNLNKSSQYTFNYDNKLFLVEVIDTSHKPIERGTFRITYLDKNYLLTY